MLSTLSFLFLVLFIGFTAWYWYCVGKIAGKEEQHTKEVEALCHPGEDTFEVVDSHDNLWKVTISAICMRRGERNL